MRVLLDECVNEELRKYFPGHDCQTARYAGFAGLENGELLAAAEAAEFDVVLTVDRGFEYQQNLEKRKIAVIIFSGKSVLLEDLVLTLGSRVPCPPQVHSVGTDRQDRRVKGAVV